MAARKCHMVPSPKRLISAAEIVIFVLTAAISFTERHGLLT